MAPVKRAAALVASVVLVAGAAVLGRLANEPDVGPIAVCHGETATHVLVEPGTVGDYAAWAQAGVAILQEPSGGDPILKGTAGHDVLVSLVSTNSGGIVGGPNNSKRPEDGGPTAGDTMCGLATGPGKNLYYGTRFPDVIVDADGESDIYAGGCKYLGPGTDSPDDDFCDVVYGNGGTDRVWGYAVPKGRTQVIYDGSEQDHNYVGRGGGAVEVYGGSSPSDVNGGGDHIHPCPDEPAVIDVGLEIKTYKSITGYDVEYFGPASTFGDDNDPCAYLPKSLA